VHSMKLRDELQEAQERRRKARHGDSHDNKRSRKKTVTSFLKRGCLP